MLYCLETGVMQPQYQLVSTVSWNNGEISKILQVRIAYVVGESPHSICLQSSPVEILLISRLINGYILAENRGVANL